MKGMIDHYSKCEKFHKACAKAHETMADAYEAKSASDDELLKRANRQLHEHHSEMHKLHKTHADHFAAMGEALTGEEEVSHTGLSAAVASEIMKLFGDRARPDNVRGVLGDVPANITPVPRHGGAPITKVDHETEEVLGSVE